MSDPSLKRPTDGADTEELSSQQAKRPRVKSPSPVPTTSTEVIDGTDSTPVQVTAAITETAIPAADQTQTDVIVPSTDISSINASITNDAIASTPSTEGWKSSSTPLPPQSFVAPAKQRLAPGNETIPVPVSTKGNVPLPAEMPDSLELVTGIKATERQVGDQLAQEEVGIIGYVGNVKGFQGVIKQRFADFLVREVDVNGQVIHLKSIHPPVDPFEVEMKKEKQQQAEKAAADHAKAAELENSTQDNENDADADPLPEILRLAPHKEWNNVTTRRLRACFSDETIVGMHALYVEGKDFKPVQVQVTEKEAGSTLGTVEEEQKEQKNGDQIAETDEEALLNGIEPDTDARGAAGSGGRGQGRDRGRGRGRGGGRGGRGGARGGNDRPEQPKDDRKVVSQPMPDKEQRAAGHALIRDVFRGVFESGTEPAAEGESGAKLVITFSKGKGKGGQANDRRPSQKSRPPFIHFTLQKTNRETQDALLHLARSLPCQNRDLTVAGTKDKRAITCQRVCLRRGTRTLDQVWKLLNGVKFKGNSISSATTRRAERGCRVGDLEYRDDCLELGMLGGNRFEIVLRNVQAESDAAINETLSSLRDNGFINFYGMQRFGTGSVPTHLTGLRILQRRWGDAVASILSLRHNEHPDCVRGRLAWLDDADYDAALRIMPRRCVAERAIWEHWKKCGGSSDKLGALGSIPRNLRTMYVHAYQSYIWNCAVSERIKMSATKPIVGDLVIIPGSAEVNQPEQYTTKLYPGHRPPPVRPALATSSMQDVKHLTEDDLDKYSIFDVVMPLPGYDVDYPAGKLGEMYERIMKADGLDHLKMRREQKEYSLSGSYRHILHKPSHLSWRIQRYTDPTVPLTSNDEDTILGINPPALRDAEAEAEAGAATGAGVGAGAAGEAEPGTSATGASTTTGEGESEKAGNTVSAHDNNLDLNRNEQQQGQHKFTAVVLDIQLASSVYATMALREVTRAETASWWQTNLTVLGEDQGFRGWEKRGRDGVEGDEGEGEGEGVGEGAEVEAEAE